MKAILHPSDSRHMELVNTLVKEKNLAYDVNILNFKQAEIGDYVVSFDYNFKHCGDTEEGKAPTVISFDEIVEIAPNGHLKVDILGDRYKIRKRHRMANGSSIFNF